MINLKTKISQLETEHGHLPYPVLTKMVLLQSNIYWFLPLQYNLPLSFVQLCKVFSEIFHTETRRREKKKVFEAHICRGISLH